MAVTTSYPGIYIEELPSTNFSITAAPTSVTVFVGYSHPFRTATFNTPVEIFNFGDYQANFGGFFELNPWLPDYLGNAVFQFFQNGGTNAWVVGLQTGKFVDANGDPVDKDGQPTADPAQQVELSAAELTWDMSAAASPGTVHVTLAASQPGGTDPNNGGAASGTVTYVQLANRRKSDPTGADYDTADIIVTRGTAAETYRAVAAANIATALRSSALVSVTVPTDPNSGKPLTPGSFPDVPKPTPLPYSVAPPWNVQKYPTTLFNPVDYTQVFQPGQSLDVDVKIFNLMVLPGISPVSAAQNAILSDALAFCEQKRAFFIMDAPSNATTSPVGPDPAGLPLGAPARNTMNNIFTDPGGANPQAPPPVSPNGAIYFPYLQTVDQVTLQPMISPPSGYVAGIFAQEDAAVSVGKAPAGLETTLLGATGVVPWGRMTDMQQGVLNSDGVNCLREFPGLGAPVVFGARTLVSANPAFQQWRYVPVRRTALFLEQSLYQSLGWVVFQENDTPLWNAITQEVSAFMLTLFRQGSYFQGSTPAQAFVVQCDSTTTTPTDQQNGIVNILVGFAPLKPAEFVVIKIAQLTGQSTS